MNNTRKEALTDAAALLSFFAVVITGLAFGSIAIANHLLPSLGVDMNRTINGFEVILLLVCGGISLIFLVYSSVIVWLFFSRLFLQPSAIWKVARIGPLCKFDRWLLKVLVGNEPRL